MSNETEVAEGSAADKPGLHRLPVKLTERRIFTYKPMQDGRKFIAQISGVNLSFKGDTAVSAARRAHQFAAAIEERRAMKGDGAGFDPEDFD